MESFSFHRLKEALGLGFDWTDVDAWLLLLDADPDPDPDPAADTLDALGLDVIELDTTNYARKAITGRTVTRDDEAGLTRWLFDDVVFADLGPGPGGPTVGGAIVYIAGEDDSSSWPALAFGDVVGATTGSLFTVAGSASGVVRVRDGEGA